MPSNHLILCHPLLLPPSILPSIRVFSNELVLHIRWPKYWNFSFSISPSNEYSGLISSRTGWFDLFAVQGTLKSSPAPHFKGSILLCSAFFMVQLSTCILSHSFVQSKPIALTTWNAISYHFLLLSPPTLPEKNHIPHPSHYSPLLCSSNNFHLLTAIY